METLREKIARLEREIDRIERALVRAWGGRPLPFEQQPGSWGEIARPLPFEQQPGSWGEIARLEDLIAREQAKIESRQLAYPARAATVTRRPSTSAPPMPVSWPAQIAAFRCRTRPRSGGKIGPL